MASTVVTPVPAVTIISSTKPLSLVRTVISPDKSVASTSALVPVNSKSPIPPRVTVLSSAISLISRNKVSLLVLFRIKYSAVPSKVNTWFANPTTSPASKLASTRISMMSFSSSESVPLMVVFVVPVTISMAGTLLSPVPVPVNASVLIVNSSPANPAAFTSTPGRLLTVMVPVPSRINSASARSPDSVPSEAKLAAATVILAPLAPLTRVLPEPVVTV